MGYVQKYGAMVNFLLHQASTGLLSNCWMCESREAIAKRPPSLIADVGGFCSIPLIPPFLFPVANNVLKVVHRLSVERLLHLLVDGNRPILISLEKKLIR